MYPVMQLLTNRLPSMIKNGRGPVLTNDMMTFFKSMYLDGNDDRSELYATGKDVSPALKKKLDKTYLNLANLPKEYLVDYKPSELDVDQNGDETVNETLWNEMAAKLMNPYLSPLFATDLTRLPMMFMFTCEHDLLRDESFLYVYRMKEAGNSVTHVNPRNAFHLILSMTPQLTEARTMFDDMIKYIVANL